MLDRRSFTTFSLLAGRAAIPLATAQSVSLPTLQGRVTAAQASGPSSLVLEPIRYELGVPLKIAGNFNDGLGIFIQGEGAGLDGKGAGPTLLLGDPKEPGQEFGLRAYVRGLGVRGPGKDVKGTAAVRIDQTADVFLEDMGIGHAEVALDCKGALLSSFRNLEISGSAVGVRAALFGGFAPNSLNFYDCRVRYNNAAIDYRTFSNGVSGWFGCQIEGNNPDLSHLEGRGVCHFDDAGYLSFYSGHWEANRGEVGFSYRGATETRGLLLAGCQMTPGSSTALRMEAGSLTAISSRILAGSGGKGVDFAKGTSGWLINVECRLDGDLSNVGSLDFGRIGFGLKPIAESPLIEAAATCVAAASGVVTRWSGDVVIQRVHNAANTHVYDFSVTPTGINHQAKINLPHAFYVNNQLQLQVAASATTPGADNRKGLGSAPLRWSAIFAGSGAITTSDAREKTPVSPLTKPEIEAAKALAREIGSYNFLSAVTEKGSKARRHVGMTVQRAIDIMQAHGLDPFAYAFICHDRWEEGDRFSFRADQLLLFVARGFEARLSALEDA